MIEIKERKIKCPRCQSENVVEIIYGYPMPSTMRKAERKEIWLGGCEVNESNFTRFCNNCGHKFLKKKWGSK